MAHSAKSSERAEPHPGLSDDTQEATSDNIRPSSSTVPKKAKGRAGHAISSDTNASTQSAQEVMSRKRPAQPPKEGGAPSKRQRKTHRQPKNLLPAKSSTTLYTSPQRAGILCLPVELHQQVLSYTSARDAARYRRVCKSTNQLVRDSERFLLRSYVGGALSRLKEAVDEFNDLETPHDTDSLVEALHVWTKRRGRFPDSRTLLSPFGSILKLMAHFFLKKDHNDQMVDRVGIALDWAWIARKYAVILTKP